MYKSLYMFLCFCSTIFGSYAGSAPFIDKCKWDDKDCLLKSTQKALPFLASGLPEFGVKPLDPLVMSTVKLEDGDLKLIFKEMTVVGFSKAKVINVERNLDKSYLILEVELPIDVQGTYTVSGKVAFLPVEGNGPFRVKSDKVLIWVKVRHSYVDGDDGQKHSKVGKIEHRVEFKKKVFMTFENLFNGDKQKAEPINALLDSSWRELIETFGKPIFPEVIHKISTAMQWFIDELEIK